MHDFTEQHCREPQVTNHYWFVLVPFSLISLFPKVLFSSPLLHFFPTSQLNSQQNVGGKEKEITSSNVQLETNGRANVHRDIQSHSYEELSTSNAGSHTYEATKKSSESADKSSSRIYINVANVPAVFSPVSCVVNVESVDDEGRNDNGIIHNSSTSAAIKGPEVRKYSTVCVFMKVVQFQNFPGKKLLFNFSWLKHRYPILFVMELSNCKLGSGWQC